MGNTCNGRRTDGSQVPIIVLPEPTGPIADTCVSPSITKDGFFQLPSDGDALPLVNVSDGGGGDGGTDRQPSPNVPLAVQSISKAPEPVKIVSSKAEVVDDAAKPPKLAEQESKAGTDSNSGEDSAARPKVPQQVKRVPSAGLLVGSVLNHKTENVKEKYSLGRRLGYGQYGTTYLCTERSTGEEFACKSILKEKLVTNGDVVDVRREIQIMHHLAGHPNVIAIRGAYEDALAVHLVMELCTGGELFDRIKKKGHYTEKKASELARIIVAGVEVCHSRGVMHRDLKPENFLFVDQTEESALKMIDFGFSVFFRPGQVFSDIVGTLYYVAPEVLKKKYGPEADVWSAGVIFYILLSGDPPFWAFNDDGITEEVLHGRLDLESYPWPSISESTKDLVRGMLHRDPEKRLTAHEVLLKFDSSSSIEEESAKLEITIPETDPDTTIISLGTTESKSTAQEPDSKTASNLNISGITIKSEPSAAASTVSVNKPSQPSATSTSVSSSTPQPQPAFSMGSSGNDQTNVEGSIMAGDHSSQAAPAQVQPTVVFQFGSQQGSVQHNFSLRGGAGGEKSMRRAGKIRRARKMR